MTRDDNVHSNLIVINNNNHQIRREQQQLRRRLRNNIQPEQYSIQEIRH